MLALRGRRSDLIDDSEETRAMTVEVGETLFRSSLDKSEPELGVSSKGTFSVPDDLPIF